MSEMRLVPAIARIKQAPPESPLAVFRSARPGHVNCVFASTLHTQRLIAQGDPDYIGTFNETHDPSIVRAYLELHLPQEA